MQKKVVWLIILMLPVLWMIPRLGDFFYVSQADYNDIAISHLPNAYTLLDGLRNWHVLPLWSDRILSGYPFIANPLSGIWYPPGLLALLFELPLGFNLVFCLHVIWGGLGIFVWLRQEGYSPPAAMFGAISFEAMPKLFAHFFAGHLTYVYAISWTGWLLLAESARLKRGWKSTAFIFTGIVWGMILMADIRWGAYAAIIWLAYNLFKHLGDIQNLRESQQTSLISPIKAYTNWLLGLVVCLGIGAAIAAPLIVPLMEYIPLTTRQMMKPEDNLVLSLPPSHLLGLLFPAIGGNPEWVIYPGIVVWVVGMAAMGKLRDKRWVWFWGLVGLFGVSFALGSCLPFAKVVSAVPGFSLLRVPPRMIMISGLAFACLGTEAFESLLYAVHHKRPISPILVIALLGFLTIFTAGIMVMLDVPVTGFIWSAGMSWLAGLAVFFLLAGKLPVRSFNVLIIGFLILDLSGSNGLGTTIHKREDVLAEKEEVAKWIAIQEGIFRVYSPSYSIPQQSAAKYRVRLSDGVDPMQLMSYSQYMTGATGVPMMAYSVTLPPFPNGDPEKDNREYLPDAGLLGILNVRFVVSEFSWDQPAGFTLRKVIDGTFIYENLTYMPRAWVEEKNQTDKVEVRPVKDYHWTPNRINLQVQGPGLLILSEINYPGWQVYVDKKSQPILEYENLLRSVELQDGYHQVVVVYRPRSFYIGLILACFVWLFLTMFWVSQSSDLRKRKRIGHDHL